MKKSTKLSPGIKMLAKVLTKEEVVGIVREHADYFLVGTWPYVVAASLPNIFTHGKKYAVAIIAVE